MIRIEKGKSLKAFNTFGFDQHAEFYTEVSNDEQLSEVIEHARVKNWPVFILGGGSNIVLSRDVPGLVIRMTGAQITREPELATGGEILTVAAGKNWHELVIESLQLGLQGLENLSLIPGSVGAAPVQNIGAYGVEVMERITRVRGLHLSTGEWVNFNNRECVFSYRDSLFKQKPNEYAITQVSFGLGAHNELNTQYSSLAHHLSTQNITSPTALDISRSVIAIRQSKLPDPTVIGNTGSFFHNPIVTKKFATNLRQKFPEVVTFDAGEQMVKVSAGWLIDQAGYKGVCQNGIGVYPHQALVLTHSGGSNGAALLQFADEIKSRVAQLYGVQLSIEPVVV